MLKYAISPENTPELTEKAHAQGLKLVGPWNIDHYHALEASSTIEEAGYELLLALCGLQIPSTQQTPAPSTPSIPGAQRLTCATCYQLAQTPNYRLRELEKIRPLELQQQASTSNPASA